MDQRIEITVANGIARTRLEDFLFGKFPNLSRMYLRGVVRDGKCEVNGRLENVGYRLRRGDFLEVEIDTSRETSMLPENIPLDIVFEDEHLIVVNKPAGMLVHPTNRDKTGTLLNALSFYLNRSIEEQISDCGLRIADSREIADRGLRIADFESRVAFDQLQSESSSVLGQSKSAIRNPQSAIQSLQATIVRPGLVHRLDKQTSGLIVVAKSTRVHRSLAKQFQKKFVEKRYLALVEGVVADDAGVIETRIGRYADEKRWDVKADGKHSQSNYRVLERRADTTLLELEPVTGRTNQLRIHCASIGHPIVGEVSRGGREFERLCLHAWRLKLWHPVHAEHIELTAAIEF